MRRTIAILFTLLISSAAGATSSDQRFTGDHEPATPHANKPEAEPPDGTLTLSIGGQDELVWPFTAADFGTMRDDPINLVFVGDVDPRNVRAVLIGLDGNRTAFGLPNAFPFNCTWRDTTGYNLASYAAGEWAAAPVQLECGEYTVLRTHLRLFRYERFTLANAHFELMVPGTAEHRILSWEFAESLVKIDLVRSGLLAGDPTFTPPFTPTPSWRTIDYRVFNGVPVPLRAVLGLPLTNQTVDVPIPNDGRATAFRLFGARPVTALDEQRSYHRDYNVPVLRPFCPSGPLDYILIKGPVDITFRVSVGEDGDYHSEQEASGLLTVTPIDPVTMTPTGPSVEARVRERQNAVLSDGTAWGESVIRHEILSNPAQAKFQKLRVGNQERFELDIDCGAH